MDQNMDESLEDMWNDYFQEPDGPLPPSSGSNTVGDAAIMEVESTSALPAPQPAYPKNDSNMDTVAKGDTDGPPPSKKLKSSSTSILPSYTLEDNSMQLENAANGAHPALNPGNNSIINTSATATNEQLPSGSSSLIPAKNNAMDVDSTSATASKALNPGNDKGKVTPTECAQVADNSVVGHLRLGRK
jgi:hypothetical protein